MNRPRLSIIAAVARNGGIGRHNELLARIPEDLQRFRRLTMGSPMLMGRKTWDSIGRPLPGRRSIVITRDDTWHAEGAEVAHSLEQALAMAAPAERAFVIGGAQVYALALPHADALELTELDADFDADVFFPAWDCSQFEAGPAEQHTGPQGLPYRFVTYTRTRGD